MNAMNAEPTKRGAAKRLLILETHPIQYRAPIFQNLEQRYPGEVNVVYASDFSVRGYKDAGFGVQLSWDTPLMSGYRSSVLAPDEKQWSRHAAAKVGQVIDAERPDAVLLHSLSNSFGWMAYWHAWRRNIPVWLRVETQDEAFERPKFKTLMRGLVYRLLYTGISKVFYIGELNREHYLRHGVAPRKLRPARYCTADRIEGMDAATKAELRAKLRDEWQVPDTGLVVSFFGKLFEKKNPDLLLDALRLLPATFGRPVTCVFVGAGEDEPALRASAESLERDRGIRTVFAGFVNQSGLPARYLASDVVVLPSRRMGETWGLVVNEALQAGCGVVMSEAVGSHRDFGGWPRVRVIPVGDAPRLADALVELAAFPRDFGWASERLAAYSVDAAATAFHQALHEPTVGRVAT